jgi:hypothetical protein
MNRLTHPPTPIAALRPGEYVLVLDEPQIRTLLSAVLVREREATRHCARDMELQRFKTADAHRCTMGRCLDLADLLESLLDDNFRAVNSEEVAE